MRRATLRTTSHGFWTVRPYMPPVKAATPPAARRRPPALERSRSLLGSGMADPVSVGAIKLLAEDSNARGFQGAKPPGSEAPFQPMTETSWASPPPTRVLPSALRAGGRRGRGRDDLHRARWDEDPERQVGDDARQKPGEDERDDEDGAHQHDVHRVVVREPGRDAGDPTPLGV